MKAVLVREFGKIGTAQDEEIDTPERASNEIRVDIAAAPANFVDTLVMEGTYQILPARPFVPAGPTRTI